jgi:hypothetical protein
MDRNPAIRIDKSQWRVQYVGIAVPFLLASVSRIRIHCGIWRREPSEIRSIVPRPEVVSPLSRSRSCPVNSRGSRTVVACSHRKFSVRIPAPCRGLSTRFHKCPAVPPGKDEGSMKKTRFTEEQMVEFPVEPQPARTTSRPPWRGGGGDGRRRTPPSGTPETPNPDPTAPGSPDGGSTSPLQEVVLQAKKMVDVLKSFVPRVCGGGGFGYAGVGGQLGPVHGGTGSGGVR